ncbi:hypothetical protein PN498_14005 [Oscillatoria sp. CS-180]|uniref:hypothetical protein n=1 Tax=Oscillatoria sp. CS-180 TaxID=3021720 RepID=UPI00232F503B|nr:hypothetical protein [Oscillatoria sp. CS-180]MDB9527111.1 hypothetical protein [Oscillatoria sp. CS-180]
MPGPPVSIGCAVIITPGAAGPPDSGTIISIFPPLITANGLPLATTGSLCTMINSLTGVPYPLVIGPIASTGVTVSGRGLVRLGDVIPTPPGVLTILGPPAAPFILDRSP